MLLVMQAGSNKNGTGESPRCIFCSVFFCVLGNLVSRDTKCAAGFFTVRFRPEWTIKLILNKKRGKIMAKDYSSIAKAVLKLIGGEENVTHFEHCSTRLRFSIGRSARVDKDGLKGPPVLWE